MTREKHVGEFWLVTNHWGWSLRGVRTWLRAGWAIMPTTWGAEYPNGIHTFLKWGPVCTRIR
jgi:hypothetical protein